MLPACIQVCPVEIPGRGRRSGEPAITDAAQFADILVNALPLQVGQAMSPELNQSKKVSLTSQKQMLSQSYVAPGYALCERNTRTEKKSCVYSFSSPNPPPPIVFMQSMCMHHCEQ